jgi:hypothetical protein
VGYATQTTVHVLCAYSKKLCMNLAYIAFVQIFMHVHESSFGYIKPFTFQLAEQIQKPSEFHVCSSWDQIAIGCCRNAFFGKGKGITSIWVRKEIDDLRLGPKGN